MVTCAIFTSFRQIVWQFGIKFVSLPAKATAMTDRETIVRQTAEYFKTQPVLKAWLFGSYARGEQREDSDVDILIVPEQGVGLFQLSGMHLDLQEMLNMPVDLVTEKGLLPFARESADHDKILIYERAA